MTSNAVGVAMRDNHAAVKALTEDIQFPEFMSEISDLASMDIIQGQIFIMPAHYDRHEQLFCAVDGFIQIKLVPHIYKQEVYAGKPKYLEDSVNGPFETLKSNESPVNFFDPNVDLYPLFTDISRRYTVMLHEGDCIYIPSFYFHQYLAKP